MTHLTFIIVITKIVWIKTIIHYLVFEGGGWIDPKDYEGLYGRKNGLCNVKWALMFFFHI